MPAPRPGRAPWLRSPQRRPGGAPGRWPGGRGSGRARASSRPPGPAPGAGPLPAGGRVGGSSDPGRSGRSERPGRPGSRPLLAAPRCSFLSSAGTPGAPWTCRRGRWDPSAPASRTATGIPANGTRRAPPTVHPEHAVEVRRTLGPLHPPDVHQRGPSGRARRWIGPQGPDQAHPGRGQPCQERGPRSGRVEAPPPGAEDQDGYRRTDQGGPGRPSTRSQPTRAQCGERPRLLRRPDQTRLEDRIPQHSAGSQGGGQSEEDGPQPQQHPGRHPIGDDRADQQTAPEEPGRSGQQPRAHTVTWSRISPRITSPIPVTSRRSSTAEKGPCSVR